MKAIKSDRLKEIIDNPLDRDKFRRFIVTRLSSDGSFQTNKGTSTTVEFVVEKYAKTSASR